MNISVVIPVYNAEGCLRELYQRLKVQLQSLGCEWEIIMVEDCGIDDSWTVINQLVDEDEHVKGLKLSRNYGQHSAVLCGIREAKYNIVITLDDDLQHPPEEIPKLLNRLHEGYDVVYGAPERIRHGFLRKIASTITKITLQKVMGAKAAKNISAFRVFKTRLRDAFVHYRSPFVSIDVLLTWGAKSFSSVFVKHEARMIGKTNYTFRMLVTHSFNMMTGFSTIPLQLASVIGFVFTIFGIVVFVYVLIRYFSVGKVVPGFPFLASIIAIFAGAQLFALGIMGEYLSRMYFRLMEQPPYVVGSYYGNKKEVG